jgi:hypothetical protein
MASLNPNKLANVLPGAGTSFAVNGSTEIFTGSVDSACLAAGAVGTDAIAANSITSAKLDTGLLQYVAVPLTSAQIKTMFTTPVVLIAAPIAGKAVILESLDFEMTRTATAYTSGGTVSIQYTTGPVAATNTIASTVVTTAGAAVTDTFRDAIDADVPSASGIEITNATGVFATGTGTAIVHLWYRTI